MQVEFTGLDRYDFPNCKRGFWNNRKRVRFTGTEGVQHGPALILRLLGRRESAWVIEMPVREFKTPSTLFGCIRPLGYFHTFPWVAMVTHIAVHGGPWAVHGYSWVPTITHGWSFTSAHGSIHGLRMAVSGCP